MTIIDRYVIRGFVTSYLLLLTMGVGLYIFGDILFNLDEFTENETLSTMQIVRNMFDYYGHNLPLYYHQLGGVMMGIAASFTFAMMLKNNELIALVAAGVPLQRLAVPTLATAAVFVGLWVANSELLLPNWAHKIARRHDDVSATRVSEVHCVRDEGNAILSAGELRAQQGELRDVYIIEPDEDGNPTLLVRADTAHYDHERETWRLERGARLTVRAAFSGGGVGELMQWEPLDEYNFSLSPEQILLRQSSQWSSLMSMRQMSQLVKTGNLPNLPAIEKSRHIRFMEPLLAFILLFLSVPFFLTCEPANVLVAGGKALVLTGLCFAFTFIMNGMPVGTGEALLVTALPVLVFAPVAVLHVSNVRT